MKHILPSCTNTTPIRGNARVATVLNVVETKEAIVLECLEKRRPKMSKVIELELAKQIAKAAERGETEGERW